jgi:choline dehydrogenase-like flavoprotein
VRIVVVGSGVSGCHAALTLLERGHDVEVWDVGRDDPTPALPGTSFHALKGELPDAPSHLLGQRLQALVPPAVPELLRYPPSRNFLAGANDPLWSFVDGGMAPYASFATGGLANGWGANALAFDDDDLAGWPVSASEMARAYRTVFSRVPVAGPSDDALAPHLTGVEVSQPPIALSMADEVLISAYAQRAGALSQRGVLLGRARMAVVTEPGRKDACDYCDRCLWGCPRGSIYNPARTTLAECAKYPGFRHLRGRYVISLRAVDGRVTGIRFLDVPSDTVHEEPCDAVFLAAGALNSGAIFLRTLHGSHPELGAESEALLDTTVVKLPYVSLRAVGRPEKERTFQFNRLILGLVGESPGWPRYLHGEVLHLTSLLYHPLIERMPFDSRTSARLFFALKSALGVVSLFFPDRATPGNRQAVVEDGRRWASVRLEYAEPPAKEALIERSLARVRAALWRLGCVPRGAARSPCGGGIHYAGTIPMGNGPKRCGPDGRSNLLRNLYVADGAAFPSLPSKSITMGLAAHATRVAAGAAL